ncbi:MAG: sigma-70 family RNA polymerase sigma factor [Lentisphaeria bacterium]|nr:sigma-70 family RNA polymerase sigma factor [Lentisphaeria bacterium]
MTEQDRNRSAQWIRDALAQHEGPLLRYATRLASGDLERARDAVQDTFVRLCEQPRSKIEDYLAPWLFRVCRNRVLELRRKEERMKPLEEKHVNTHPADGASPAATAERKDSLSIILRLLGGLPGNQQEVVRLKFQNEMSYKQISRVTGLSVTNVGFLLHTAIRKLRAEMHQLEA